MAETRFEWTLDGEDAGAGTPWEFDSISESGGATFALDAAAANNGSNGYRFTASAGNAFGVYAWTNTDKPEYWVRFYMYVNSAMTGAAFSTTNICILKDGGSQLGRMGFSFSNLGAPNVLRAGWAFGYTSGSSVPLDQWFRVEIKMVTDGAAGGLQVYLNGVSDIVDLDQDTSGSFWDNMNFGLADGSPASSTVDFDDIVGDVTQPGVNSDDAVGGIVVLRRRRSA